MARTRVWQKFSWLVLAGSACGTGEGMTGATSTGATAGMSTSDTGTTVGMSTSDTGTTAGMSTSSTGTTAGDSSGDVTTGGAPAWPPPYTPTPSVDVVLDPAVELGEGPCIHLCEPAVREELPPVMDLCELLGGHGLASGPCDGGACPVPAETCMNDEFEFGDNYCALDGLPAAYCGGYPQQDDDHVVVATRITHRLVGSQLVFEFDPGDATPGVQVYLQEGWDEIDDMGNPWPIPSRLTPTGGTITLKDAGFTAGATLSGTYELTFAWPDDPSITRTIRGHFAHML